MSSRRVTDTVSRGVRILYLHQFFMTRAGGGGTRSYEFARHLVGAGPRGDDGNRGAGDRAAPRTVDGIEVVEVGGAYADYMRATRDGLRRAGSAAFGRFAAGRHGRRAAGAAARRGVRHLAAADDRRCRPSPRRAATARRWCSRCATCGRARRSRWARCATRSRPRAAARALERAAYRAAAHVVALSPGNRATGVAGRRAWRRSGSTMIPNASDLDLFSPDVDPGDLRERLGLGDAFVCSLLRHDGRGQRPDPGGRGGHAAARPRRERRDVRAPGRGQAPRRRSRTRCAAAGWPT